MKRDGFSFFSKQDNFNKEFIQLLDEDKITLEQKTLAGNQASLLIAAKGLQKYIIFLKTAIENRYIASLQDESDLCKRLMHNPHPNIMGICSISSCSDGETITQLLTFKAFSPEYQGSSLLSTLASFSDLLESYKQNLRVSHPNKDMEIKKPYLEQITIGEYIEGISLDKVFNIDEESAIQTTQLADDEFANILRLFKAIYLGILHINCTFGAHGDISLFNILKLKNSDEIKIIDMGCATQADSRGKAADMKDRDIGSLGNVAPEVLFGKEVQVGKIDTYSLGIILMQMLFRVLKAYDFNELKELPEKFPRDHLEDRYKALLLDTDSTWINPDLLAKLPDSKNGENIKKLLTLSLRIKPESRLHIVDFLHYLDFSESEKTEIISRNILLAFQNNNPSYIQAFYQSMKAKNLEDNFFTILLSSSKNNLHFILLSFLDSESITQNFSNISQIITQEIKKESVTEVNQKNLKTLRKFIGVWQEEKLEYVDEKSIISSFRNQKYYKDSLVKFFKQHIMQTIKQQPKEKNLIEMISAAEVLLIVSEKLIELEEQNISLTDMAQCIHCLKYISAFHQKYPKDPFIEKISNIYSDLLEKRTEEVTTAETKAAAQAFIQAITDKKNEDIIAAIQQSSCYPKNPIFYRPVPTQLNALDYLVNFINQTQDKDLTTELTHDLMKKVYLQDEKESCQWRKLSLIECQLLYALARHQNRKILATPGTLDRLFKHLQEFKIDFESKLTGMAVDGSSGYYVCNLEEKKFEQVISSSKTRWEQGGKKVMENFNLLVNSHLIDEQFARQIRECIYNTCAMPGNPNGFLWDFMNRVSCITVPQTLKSFFENFINDINRLQSPDSPETSSIVLLA